ncbi:thioredoxin domain-containing protein [Gracilibacillus suaedae]|uniref:hypothetical protein n=1 Tax=Gracilibacillus suaedae TaxID=2820273 RepID=UPI001ABE25EC|nr:hypothetical protein [Gracilibacillus suaedae]
MKNQSYITLFIRKDHLESELAKSILRDAGSLYFTRLDVEDSHYESAVTFFSGKATIPQIFVGDYPIGSTDELKKLWETRHLRDIMHSVRHKPKLNVDAYTSEELARGAEDVKFMNHIPESDGTKSGDPEQWPILHFYKDFFGFWPNTFVYLHHWQEVYKRFVYCHNMPTIQTAKDILGTDMLCAVGYATSNAHGCNYCQVHSVATMGESSMSAIEQLRLARIGQYNSNNPFDEYWVSLADLASMSSLNKVPPHYLDRLRRIAADSEHDTSNLNEQIMSVALVSAAFGFLNVFNDLVGMEIEGAWAVSAKQRLNIDEGRHAVTSELNPNNLAHDLPVGGPSIAEIMKKYEADVGDYSAYNQQRFGVIPPWIPAFPNHLRPLHTNFYSEIMTQQEGSPLTEEIKHLMAYVSHIEKQHIKLAESEAFMAHFVSNDKLKTIKRIKHAFAIASNRGGEETLFTDEERAALQLAYLSAQMPLITPRRFIKPVIDHFNASTCIELFVVCGIASLVQRFTAIIQWPQDQKISDFIDKIELNRDLVSTRFPLP